MIATMRGLVLVLLTFAGTPCLTLNAQAEKPNIILIMADDLGVEGINVYGGEYRTPHIDELARNGMKFSNAHAMPLCTPSRTRLMTARENGKNYVAFAHLDPGERTFAHAFNEAGYVTGITGKWQLAGNGFDGKEGALPGETGFDEWFLWQVSRSDARGSRYWGPTHETNKGTQISEEGFGPDLRNDFAIDFISRHKDEPFFLYYPMVLPHDPWVVTPDSMPAQTRQDKFAGMVTYMDKMVGRLVDHVHQLGLSENTIIVFLADNGTDRRILSWWNGERIEGGKGDPTLSGTHVPLIISWPSHIGAGLTNDDLVDIMDLYPTLADLAGIENDSNAVDGVSHASGILNDQAEEEARSWIYMHYAPVWINEPSRFIFDKDRKLYEGGPYVRLDPTRNKETPLLPGGRTEEDEERLSVLRSLMEELQVAPLDQARFPMCEGEQSLAAGVPATIAGCVLNGVKLHPDMRK